MPTSLKIMLTALLPSAILLAIVKSNDHQKFKTWQVAVIIGLMLIFGIIIVVSMLWTIWG